MERLGEMLVDQGLISAAQLETALHYQAKRGGKLGDVLIHLAFVDDRRMAEALAAHHKLPLAFGEGIELREDLMSLLPRETIEGEEILPIRREKHSLTLAMSDPTALDLVEEIRFTTGLEVETVIIPHGDCRRLINRYYYGVPGPKPSKIRPAVPPGGAAPSSLQREGRGEGAPLASPLPPPGAADAAGPGAPAGAGFRAPVPATGPTPAVVVSALVQLLIEKGIIRREELLARISARRQSVAVLAAVSPKTEGPPPPQKP